ncbi:glycine zipper 2TM domain-containing protein [uncultured Paraglaciecola sp.]|uniref:glycine zipper 2TM domain-containing protein n=1 Tax=uncultured Paraglaciecola sp. TaxID=1765024 RepID=UPI00260236E4|nr:glycine zipper 2TM domain-containing protein [uncultured Paraglaciecola sp.]
MKLLITSALLFLATSPLVQAKHDRRYQSNHEHNRGELKAKVITFNPYKYVTVTQPQIYCAPAQIRSTCRRFHDSRRHYKSSAIFGGVLGGVIGHAASDKNHKGLGAILGAMIGSSLVHNIRYVNNNHSHNIPVKRDNCVITPRKANEVRVLPMKLGC